ncbi:hypothetical protein ACIA5C_00975 [Actinoplanes sp. NPDC051343]|uniref:hypothetical protein n=1 Tax=Actinoplanes sp. NPDC051343 TaxID=3363906 RepID=UPI0037A7473F
MDHITERGIVVDGLEYEVDLISYSTGLDSNAYRYEAGGYQRVGRGGVSLAGRRPPSRSTSRTSPLVRPEHVAALIARFLRAGVTVAEARGSRHPYHRGHEFLTIVVDHDTGNMVSVGKERVRVGQLGEVALMACTVEQGRARPSGRRRLPAQAPCRYGTAVHADWDAAACDRG